MATADPDLDEALHAELGVLYRRIPDGPLRKLEGYAAEIFRAFGMDLDSPATRDTPHRFIRALYDVTAGASGAVLEFRENLQLLIDLARRDRVVRICAEVLPWRCHRWLIADALSARGLRVEHIMSEDHCRDRSLSSWARVRGTAVTYPAEPGAEVRP